jgi:hypothetical protein
MAAAPDPNRRQRLVDGPRLLAGAVLAGIACLLFPDLLAFRLLAVALLVTGLACGLICRTFARWPEDADATDQA